MSIIFIAGLTRSGTTFLQSQLVRYENVVALGEVIQTIQAIKNINIQPSKWKIKLGLKSENYWTPKTYIELIERVRKDIFWSDLENDIRTARDIESAIELVYAKAEQVYPNHIIIDSSKNIASLKYILNINKFKGKVKVIMCIRDYRGWLYSTKKHQRRAGIHQRSNLLEMYKWLYSNKKLLSFLDKNLANNYKIISYDKLIFFFSKQISELSDFCTLGKKSDLENMHKFHEILGSPTLKINFDSNNLEYDSIWFSHVSSCFEWPVSNFNRKVYLQLSKNK
ncbi:sulfotransferase [Parafilimonas sp.]|uniref:sulfotransferase n=1 Tax=Parafilimonas sp. TaxID=1969739 RepID=UPI003F81C6A0